MQKMHKLLRMMAPELHFIRSAPIAVKLSLEQLDPDIAPMGLQMLVILAAIIVANRFLL